jgi:hypothetical protein
VVEVALHSAGVWAAVWWIVLWMTGSSIDLGSVSGYAILIATR